MTVAESKLNRVAPAEAEAIRAETAGTDAAVTAESAASCDDAVGHGKPPKQHQFKKGNRASIEGKRRKVKAAEEVVPQLPNDSVHGMLMAEAMRMVRVKAGGRLVEIPAMQAAFREIAMKAARGNRLAAATLARLIMQSEAAEARAAALAEAQAPASSHAPAGSGIRVPKGAAPGFEAAVEYKQVWTRVLSKAKLLKAVLGAPVPHPDEVRIGEVRGTADWPGAAPGVTLSLDRLAATHAELQAELPARRPGIEAMSEGYDKAAAWCDWFALIEVRDLIAEHLPHRYARQIHPDRRAAEERSRDNALRSMALHDRSRHKLRLEREAADRQRTAAMCLPGEPRWHGDGGHEDGGQDGADGAKAPVPAGPPVVEIAGDPAQTIAEAEVYLAAWAEVLEVTDGMRIRLEPPMPPPDDVIIDPRSRTVVYRVPPAPGRRATLDNLRATLAAMTAAAVEHNGDITRAALPRFAEDAERKRDEMLALRAVVEWHLAGADDGG